MPADLTKGENGSWKVKGLASTSGVDQQGETIIQKGIDLTPIDQKRGVLNWDHKKGPENTIGTLDGYSFGENGLYVEGNLFKNHDRAKAVKQIMDSLGDGDRGRMGLSVEGQILERDAVNPKIIKKCKISAVALTMNPVNSSTYATMFKSMSGVDFDATEENIEEVESDDTQATFSADQVVAIVKKALGMSPEGSYSKAPNELTNGDAMATSTMKPEKDDKKKDKKKRKDQDESQAPAQENGLAKTLKPMTQDLFKSNILKMMDKLQKLHPDVSRIDIWEAVKERIDTRFPNIYSAEEENKV